MKDFRCSCIGCGKTPEFGATGIWMESSTGMLCESCWRAAALEKTFIESGNAPAEGEFCCYCALCRRTPPDPEYKLWIETDSGCICEKCWKELAGKLLAEKAGSTAAAEGKEGLIDIQFGCCLINKKLLIKSLSALAEGADLNLMAENSDSLKSTARKYIEGNGCKIVSIEDKNGTCIIKVRREKT